MEYMDMRAAEFKGHTIAKLENIEVSLKEMKEQLHEQTLTLQAKIDVHVQDLSRRLHDHMVDKEGHGLDKLKYKIGSVYAWLTAITMWLIGKVRL